MPFLTTSLTSGRFAQGLRVRNTYRVLGRRDAAVGTGLDYGFRAALKLGDAGLQLFNLSVLADKTAIQDINDKTLLMQFLGQFRGVKVLGKPHTPEELLAPAGEFHPVSLKAFSLSGIKVFSHTTKVGKRSDICKFNTLIINGLRDVCEPSGEDEMALFGGPDAKFLKALNGL